MTDITNYNLADVATCLLESSATTDSQAITNNVDFITTCKEVSSDIRGFIPNAQITMAALEVFQYVIPSLQCNPATTVIGVVSILLNKEEKLSRRLFFATVFIMASQLTLLSGIGFAQPIFMAISAYRHGGLLAKIGVALAGVEVAKKAVPAIARLAQSYLTQSVGAAPAIAAAGSKWASEFGGQDNLYAGQNAHSLSDGLPGSSDKALQWVDEYDSQEFGSAFGGNNYYEENKSLKAADTLKDLYANISQASPKLGERADWADEFTPKTGLNISKISPQQLAQEWVNEFDDFNVPDGFSTRFPKGFEEAWKEAGSQPKQSQYLGTVVTVLAAGAFAYQHRESIKEAATAAFGYVSQVFGEESDNLVEA